MLMRPGFRVGRPSLLGTVARTAVVAGTATAVAGGVSRRQQGRAQQEAEAEADEQQQQAAATPAAPPPPPPPAPGAAADDTITQLERLAALKQQGILTDAEFQAQKTKLLGL
jgi:Short C-terminal domain